MHTQGHQAPHPSSKGFKENFTLSSLKGTLAFASSRVRAPRGGFGLQWRGAPKDSRARGAEGTLHDWPRLSGHMEAPPPDVPGLDFQAFGAGRPHKDGIHGKVLNSLRNEAGFK